MHWERHTGRYQPEGRGLRGAFGSPPSSSSPESKATGVISFAAIFSV